jgi:hypothetical protein
MSLRYIKRKSVDWGCAQWARPLIDVLMDGVAGIADYQARQLLDDRYHRLQIVFAPDETIPMDAVDKLDRMDEIAMGFDLSTTVEWINDVWNF